MEVEEENPVEKYFRPRNSFEMQSESMENDVVWRGKKKKGKHCRNE